jgi:hypothetical protein
VHLQVNKLHALGPRPEPLREKERQQRDHDEKAAKQAKQRASARERMQKLRNNEAFRELEVRCYTHNAVCCFRTPRNVNGTWT